MKRAILFVTFAALCGAQTTVNGGRDYKGTLKASGSVSAVDFSGAGGTAPAKAGTSASRTTACTQGQIYFATDVAAGQNLYFCTVTGAPGVWTQMSGNAATAVTSGTGAPAGNCTPPVVYIDTTNQDLWFCGAANLWKKPTADTSGLATLTGTNTWTGYSNLSGGQWRPPESTVANLPASAGNVGKVFMVTDAVTAGSCSTGGGLFRELCRANASTYECVGGCGSSGGSSSATTAYISPLVSGPDSTRTITGATHGFATTALLVAAYDNASPRNAISIAYSVNSSTYDVAITFASPQSNYYVVVNGGVGPQGPAGPQGPSGVSYCATSSASGTTYTCAPSPAVSSYAAGVTLAFVPDVTSGALPTVNANGLGAKNIKMPDGSTPPSGAFAAGGQYLLVYDGTSYRLVRQGNSLTLSGSIVGAGSLNMPVLGMSCGKVVMGYASLTGGSSTQEIPVVVVPANWHIDMVRVNPAAVFTYSSVGTTLTVSVQQNGNSSAPDIIPATNIAAGATYLDAVPRNPSLSGHTVSFYIVGNTTFSHLNAGSLEITYCGHTVL